MLRKIHNLALSLIVPFLFGFVVFGLLGGPEYTGMIVSDGGYISPTSDSSYVSPTSDGGYKSPTADANYVSPTSDNSYKTPTSDSSYVSPTSDGGYKSPISDGSYKSVSSDSNYISPTSDSNYKTAVSDNDYKSAKSDSNYTSAASDGSYNGVTSDQSFNLSGIGAGFSGIVAGPGLEKLTGDKSFKILDEDKNYKRPDSDKDYVSPTIDGSYKIPDSWSPYERPSLEPRLNISTGPGFISVEIGYGYNATTIGEGLLTSIIDSIKVLDNSTLFTVIDQYSQNSSVIVINISNAKDQSKPSKDLVKIDAIKQAVNSSQSGFYLLSIEFFGSGNVFGYVQDKDGKTERDIFSLDNNDLKLVIEAGKTIVLRPAPVVSKNKYDLNSKPTGIFVGYRGDCLGKPEVCVLKDSAGNCVRAETRCTFVMDSDKSIQMLYAPKQPPKEYELEVIVKGGSSSKVISAPENIDCGSGNACLQNFSANKFVSLTAIAGNNEAFSSWSGWCSGINSTCRFNMEKHLQVTANFEKKGIVTAAISWIGSMFSTKKTDDTKIKQSNYRTQAIVSHDAAQDYPSACDDYPTMPGCPGEGTNIAPPPSPTIPEVTFTSFEPRKAYQMTPVFIKGKNLGYVSKVYFNGELVEGFSISPNGEELQTLVPQGAQTGEIALLLTSGAAEYSAQDFIVWTGVCSNKDVTKAFKQLNKLPQGQKDEDDCNIKKYLPSYSKYKELRNAIQKAVGFSKLSPPKISFNPSVALPGQEISIIGPMLDVYADEVKFDGKSIAFKLIDEKEVKLTVPEDAVFGEHEITIVSDIHGTGSAKIKIVPLPAIYSLKPSNVFTSEEITITGENLYEPQEISFYEPNTKKEVLTKNFRKESLQQIKVNAPQEPGSYIITVKAKNSFVRAQKTLSVAAKPSPPQITSIEPEEARFGGNAIVYGSNLNYIQSITLNGQRMSYTPDASGTSVTLTAVLDKPLQWGIHQGVVKIKTVSGEAQAELLSNKKLVTKLVTGKEETCFGGVGKGCYGSEDGKEEWGWGSQKIIAPVGCSNEVNGQRNCWSVPGSIKHDNCCVRYPSGKMCGGPGKDGQPAGENNHDGHCVDEWHAAFWDVFWWHAFVVTFDVTKPTDLTPKPSKRFTLKDDDGNLIPSETAETLRFCAPPGHELREQSDEGFCCSGKAVNKKCTSARGVLTIGDTVTIPRTENGADLSKVPIPLAPGEQPKVEPVPKPQPITSSEFELEIEGAFSGSVKTADGKIINCRNQNKCTAKYPKGTKVTLIATPDMADYENSGWFGDCTNTPKTENCILTMDSYKKVNLGFFKKAQLPPSPSEFELEIEGAFSGSVKTADGKIINCRNQNKCKAKYPKGTKVILIATPDMVDYENSGWFGDCTNTPKTENCVLTMDSNKKVNLGFFKKQEIKPPVITPQPANKTKRWWQKPICIRGRYCVRPVLG